MNVSSLVRTIGVSLLLAMPLAARAEDMPIDCPFHQKNFDHSTMRPFEETEKWIEFLDKPERAAWQKPDEVVQALGLSGSETVVDVGAGSGYFTFRLAKALPKGVVIATDIDPEFVRHIHRKVMTDHLANVKVVLADPDDPSIDPAADLVFVCVVIHHVKSREPWLRKLFAEMKQGARFVVIEFKEGKLPEGPPEDVKIPTARLIAMVREAGFVLKEEKPESVKTN
jgi:ubiquinone/menaquinone biosynthesis C-methylase UbiE